MLKAFTSHRLSLLAAGFFGTTAIAVGAFGAHGLKQSLSPEQLAWINTGADYQLAHALALLGLAALIRSTDHAPRLLTASLAFFCVGILLFSGSLYLLPLKQALPEAMALPLVIATPMGGTCFICGWICLAIAGWRWTR